MRPESGGERRSARCGSVRRPRCVKAAELRAETDRRQPTTDKLLAELHEFEGVEFAPIRERRPLPLPRDPKGVGVTRAFIGDGALTDTPFRAPEVRDDPGLEIVLVPTPRTQLLRIEAAELERRAEALEQRTVPAAGQVIGETTAALLDQVRALDPVVLGPTLVEADAWATPSEARQRARLARLRPEQDGFGSRVALTLVWKDGRVDPARSRALVPALDA